MLISVSEAAEKIGVAKVTIYNWIKSEGLKFKLQKRFRMRDRKMIDEKELEEFVRNKVE